MATFDERFEAATGILPSPTFDERFPRSDEVMPQGTHPLLEPDAYSVPPAAPRLPPVTPTTAAPDAVPAIRARTPSVVTVHPAYHWGEWQRMQNQPPAPTSPTSTPTINPNDPGEFFHRFLNDPTISRHLPPFMRGIGDVRTPADAFKFFTGILDNPEIARNLPPFFRGADSPFRSILGFIGRQNGWPLDGNNLPTGAPAGSKPRMGPGSGTGRGRTAGSDIPAAGAPGEEAGLAPDTRTDPLDPDMLGAQSPFDPSLSAGGTSPSTLATRSAGASTAPGVSAGSPDGDPTTPAGAPDGSPPDSTRIGPPAPADAPAGIAGRPQQGWPEADFGPGLGPMTHEGKPLPPGSVSVPARGDAVRSIRRQTENAAPVSGVSPRLSSYVRKTEGFNPRAYHDFKQYSIGYGTKARSPNERITREEAEKRLNQEIGKAQSAVNAILPADAPQNVRDALASFSYNVGTGWTRRSTLAMAARQGNWPLVAQLMQHYNHAGGQINPGLARRRREEARWLLS